MKPINRILIMMLCGLLLVGGCSRLRQMRIFGGGGGYGDISPSDLEKLRMAYQDGRTQALEDLISIYEDGNQPYDIRISAGQILAETHHPTALNAIARTVADAEALDLTFMEASIGLLARFKDNPKAADAMVHAMHAVEDKTNGLHLTLVRNLNKVRTEDQILALLDLYEVAKSNLARTEKLLAETLGALGTDEVVPVLVEISKNPDMPIGIRNRAVEILGKKDPTQVVGAFTELLGDPQTNLEVRDFALNTLSGVKEENLILTLLDTYNTGKKQYFSLLNTMLDALGEFDDPEVKKAVIEIARNKEYDRALRQKAIRKLATFNDPEVIPPLLPLMDQAENYLYQNDLVFLIEELGQGDAYMEDLRRRAYQAQLQAQDE